MVGDPILLPEHRALEEYYSEAGPDYAAWSKSFNMHFGFFRIGMNPFHRESMLEQMNFEILRRLRLEDSMAPKVLDLGCGVGATLRSFARRLPSADLTGITLVPWQLQRGRELCHQDGSDGRVRFVHGDYERTNFAAESFDAAYAIESSCHAGGIAKRDLLAETYRVLRPGGRLVVADGFLSRRRAMLPIQRRAYRKLCACWVIDTLADLSAFTNELKLLGFRDIVVERMQHRVAPSTLHIPFVALKFLVGSVLLGRERITRARWNNVIAPVLLPFVSQPIGPMLYCIVSATKGHPQQR